MGRIEVELLGKKCYLKAPDGTGGILAAVDEVQRRGEEVMRRSPALLSREDIFLIVALNLARELQQSARDESR